MPVDSTNFDMFICPITHGVMTDPVVSADGYSYERAAIEQWLATSRKSPVTGLQLPHKHLVPNQALRTFMKSLCDDVDRRLARLEDEDSTPPRAEESIMTLEASATASDSLAESSTTRSI